MAAELPGGDLRAGALAAHVYLRLDAAREYGLVRGGPGVDVDRCEEVLAQARELGIALTEAEIDEATAAVVGHHAAGGRGS